MMCNRQKSDKLMFQSTLPRRERRKFKDDV